MVHQEIQSIFQKHQIKKFACKKVIRKYAFEVPGVPSEAEYLKIVYPFSSKIIRML
jgi:DNA polymerase alpha subunit A